uniref:HAUS augmin-like complex subunit 5 n=1 Tax=Pristiophorus japonicus TaxID=55135 RepID=UPI00398F8579
QDVRGACFGRFQFLKSLYNEQDRPTDRNGDGNHDLRRVMYQQWLSQVEGLNTTHPPNHILAALESLAAENKEELVELSSKVDVVKDMEALRFAYTSSHLQDVSEPTAVLRSVKSLLEEGWMECEVRAVEKIGAVRRERETSATLELLTREFSLLLEEQYGNSPQQLSITREALELEASVADRGTCLQELTEQGHLLAVAIQARNREIQTLQQKHARILDFQTLVEGKQDLIRALVKGNSSAKSHLMKTQNEIALFVATKLETHEQTIRSLTGDHHDSLAREVNLFAAISLPCLDRRVMHEVQRVPVHKLSIHRMDASINNPQFSRHLKNTLSFPLYKAPERLIGRAMELKMEVLALRVRLCHQREYLQSQHDVTLVTDAQALSQRVQEQNAECRNVTIPAIEQLLDQCNEAIGLTDVLRGEVQDW